MRTSLSTDYTIVFPLNGGKEFSRAVYSSSMTQGRASSDDIDRALKLFELIFARSNISKVDLYLSLFWGYFVPYVVLSFFSSMISERELIWTWFFIYCLIRTGYMFYDRNQQTKRARTDCELIIKTIQPGYLKRGLRWHLPEDSMDRIELIKEYCNNGKVRDPAGISGSNNVVKPQYQPSQSVPQEVKTTMSYPPIYTVGLSSK